MPYLCLIDIKSDTMKRSLIITVTLVASLLAGSVTAQGQKTTEKKIRIVTVDDNGAKRDTTMILSDTSGVESEGFVFTTEDGKVIRGMGRGEGMLFLNSEQGRPGFRPMPPFMRERAAAAPREGVSYNITIDGVTVTIRAPKEKMAEADQILEYAKKVMTKK